LIQTLSSFFKMKSIILALLASRVLAHTGFSTFYVNGATAGDAVGVRMRQSLATFNSPIPALDSDDMACGGQGTTGVAMVVPVPDGASMTFEFRSAANVAGGKVMDQSHLGPCSVYMKKVDSAVKDPGTGDGWFKIWDEGYDTTANQWCTGKVINNGGLLTVNAPKGLVGGYYLVRPELLTLHSAISQNNPQYYVGCAQVFLQSNGTMVPEATVAIPGHVKLGDAADHFNIYDKPLKLPYPMPGPAVATFKSGGTGGQTDFTEGNPSDCFLQSGNNFCAKKLTAYTDAAGCQAAASACSAQIDDCNKNAPITGNKQCGTLQKYCDTVKGSRGAGGSGPPDPATAIQLQQQKAAYLGPTSGGGMNTAAAETAAPAVATSAVSSAAAVTSVVASGYGTSMPAPAATTAAPAATPAVAAEGAVGTTTVTTVVYVTIPAPKASAGTMYEAAAQASPNVYNYHRRHFGPHQR
jgi:Auxiliary Activity family 9 (formerly GH61)